jgi:hypothetical protein
MSRFVLFSYRGSHKVCRTPDFALGLEPVLKVLAREGAAFYIDFVSATPDLVVIWCAICGNVVRVRRNGVCVKLQNLASLAFQCHTRVLSFAG